VALRDIKKGEEIAYDYALTECHEAFRLNCRCGTSKVALVVSFPRS
jgi:SET domain-containing protein